MVGRGAVGGPTTTRSASRFCRRPDGGSRPKAAVSREVLSMFQVPCRGVWEAVVLEASAA